jgi:glycosyltransferase involved in cell wall biosynthesis
MSPSIAQRMRQTGRLLRMEGADGVAARLRVRAALRLAPPGTEKLPITREDLLGAAAVAADGWRLPAPLPVVADEPLTVAWVCTAPSAGSGGHTTMFRMVSALEQAGHTCIVYLLDRHGWDLADHVRTVRTWWPWVQAEVRHLDAGIEDAHAIVATGWVTAYPVLASRARGARLYLVQDFEPSFAPAGSESLMAEATYRFGFHGVTAGRWLAEVLRRDYDMPADHFDFGCDLERYRLEAPAGGRTGVCYYCRPSTPRRAYELAVMALDLFAAQHPEIDIHFYGEPAGRLPFAATDHGLLSPEALNQLYNRCVAGLVLSATNVSLVPHELLASGCIPVVNDADHNRLVLDNDHVVYAGATPFELAGALSRVVERSVAERDVAARQAAASVQGSSWDDAGAAVERIVRTVVGEAAAPQGLTA